MLGASWPWRRLSPLVRLLEPWREAYARGPPLMPACLWTSRQNFCLSVSRGGSFLTRVPVFRFAATLPSSSRSPNPRYKSRPRLRARQKTMSALVLTAFCFVPFLLLALAFIRSTALTKFLDDPHRKRRE